MTRQREREKERISQCGERGFGSRKIMGSQFSTWLIRPPMKARARLHFHSSVYIAILPLYLQNNASHAMLFSLQQCVCIPTDHAIPQTRLFPLHLRLSFLMFIGFLPPLFLLINRYITIFFYLIYAISYRDDYTDYRFCISLSINANPQLHFANNVSRDALIFMSTVITTVNRILRAILVSFLLCLLFKECTFTFFKNLLFNLHCLLLKM